MTRRRVRHGIAHSRRLAAVEVDPWLEIHGDAGEALHIYTEAHPAFRELSRGKPWWKRPLWP